MTFPVKNFNSNQSGAPTLTGEAGSLLALLDACLIDGFNLRTLDSLVVAGGVATGAVSTGHGYKLGEIIAIAGATPSGLNGEQKVTSVTATEFTFATTEADVTATGTITAKVAPVGGWEKAFTGTNTTAYRSTEVTGNRHYFRVFDNHAGSGLTRFARIRGYEAMTDVDTGTGLFPLAADAGGDGMIIFKSYTTDSLARSWALIADEKTVYLVTYPRDDTVNYENSGAAYCFGEIVSFRPSDAFGSILIANEASYGYTTSPYNGSLFCSVNADVAHPSGHFIARRYDQLSTSVRFGKIGEVQISGTLGGGGMPFPCPVDGGLWLAPIRVAEDSTGVDLLRGRMPGLFQALHAEPLAKFDTVSGITDLPNRELLCVPVNRSSSWGLDGQAFFDLTGPWR